MKRFFWIFFILAVLAIAYWLVSPLFINKEVSEGIEKIVSLADTATDSSEKNSDLPEIISSGSFVGIQGHNAEGRAVLIKSGEKYFVRFEEDFRVTNGPDLFVHFGKDGEYAATARLDGLKGNVGSQNYEVPSEINPEDFNEVWVWCRAFSVGFAQAILQ